MSNSEVQTTITQNNCQCAWCPEIAWGSILGAIVTRWEEKWQASNNKNEEGKKRSTSRFELQKLCNIFLLRASTFIKKFPMKYCSSRSVPYRLMCGKWVVHVGSYIVRCAWTCFCLSQSVEHGVRKPRRHVCQIQ